MDLENTCSAWGAKLLWKTKILAFENILDCSTADMGFGKQIPHSDLEHFRQIEDLDIEHRANTRFDL
jgi:hypothetical protein